MCKARSQQKEIAHDTHAQSCATGNAANYTRQFFLKFFLFCSVLLCYVCTGVDHSDYEGMMPARYLRHGAQPEEEPSIYDMPQLEPFWAAGFSFSRGHFKMRVPYDAYQPMVFQVCTHLQHAHTCTYKYIYTNELLLPLYLIDH